MGDPATASSGIVDNIKTITTSLFGALGLIAVMLTSALDNAIENGQYKALYEMQFKKQEV